MGGGREAAVLGIRTWASLLAISDTSYSQTMTMLLATSAHATHGVDYNWDDLLNMVHEKNGALDSNKSGASTMKEQ